MNAKERESAATTLAIAKQAIAQQQDLITTYEGAVKTLTTLVELTLKRVEKLENERDKANKRAALLGIALTIVGAVVAVVKR